MEVYFLSNKIKKSFDNIILINWIQFILICFILLIENFGVGLYSWGITIIKIIIVYGFFQLYLNTKKNLYYSFWTFSLVLLLWISFNLYQLSFVTYQYPLKFIYLLSLFLLIYDIYILNSPIYYPIISWWEYDFRYKHDLKVSVICNKKSIPGILVDIRRNCACLRSFDNLLLGEKISIKLTEEFFSGFITGNIITRRQTSIGRPINYGIVFNPEDVEKYLTIRDGWKKIRLIKKELKYKVNNEL